MKKYLALFLIAVLALSMSACGSAPYAQPAAETTAEPAAVSEDTLPGGSENDTEAEEIPGDVQTGESAQPDGASADFRFSTEDREGTVWDETVFSQYDLTMINFWEPWCGPCVGEMPDLQRLQETYADRGLLILGVYGTPGMEQDVDEVLSQTGVQYPILHYCDSFDVFQSGYVPTTVFVDREGHVLHHELNELEREYLSDVIKALGEEQASALYIGSNSYDGWAAIVEAFLP